MSSPLFLQGHIQLADKETLSSPFSRGAQIMFVSDLAIELILPILGLINPVSGNDQLEVATPFFPYSPMPLLRNCLMVVEVHQHIAAEQLFL